MKYYAVFLEPPQDLLKISNKLKKNHKRHSISDLVNHPPHITVLTFLDHINNVLQNIQFKAININITKKDYFYTKPDTYTLFLNVKNNNLLINLHSQIINLANKNSSQIMYSHVNANWKPHLTIAQTNDIKIAQNFKNEKFNQNFLVNKISYCVFENGIHKELDNRYYD